MLKNWQLKIGNCRKNNEKFSCDGTPTATCFGFQPFLNISISLEEAEAPAPNVAQILDLSPNRDILFIRHDANRADAGKNQTPRMLDEALGLYGVQVGRAN